MKLINDGKSEIWKYDKDEWEYMIKSAKELKPPFFIGYKPNFYIKVGENK